MSDTVHVVVPGTIDDPARPSGGNVYDRRVCNELGALGWALHEHALPGSWPEPSSTDEALLADVLDAVGDEVVLVDGLVASAAPALVTRYAERHRVVVLVHLPLGVAAPGLRAAEGAMLRRVAGVVVTSTWTRSWLVEHEAVPADRIRVAVPGADVADLAPGSPSGGTLLCVGAVTPEKGHDLLLDALSELTDLEWGCTCVGSADVDPGFARSVAARAEELDGRVVLTGALDRAAVDAAYRAADVLVLPSRVESYGMVVTEALARGLPVIAFSVGGVTEALGTGGVVPGVLVPPGDPQALAAALRTWLDDPTLRARARTAARDRRLALPTWADTAARIGEVLRPAVSQHRL